MSLIDLYNLDSLLETLAKQFEGSHYRCTMETDNDGDDYIAIYEGNMSIAHIIDGPGGNKFCVIDWKLNVKEMTVQEIIDWLK